jgi:fatty acid desaturase
MPILDGRPRMSAVTVPPRPAALSHLKSSDVTGASFAASAVAATSAALWLASQESIVAWLAGQLLLAAALVEWFVLLHECGHGTLFRGRTANVAVGQLAGVLAMIPFPIWTRIHGRHHKWTGWQDVDPTTTALAPRHRAAWERAVVNFCWKYWIPLFSVTYRIANFWNIPRLIRLFPDVGVQRRLVVSAVIVVALYLFALVVAGPATIARLVGIGLLLSLVIQDVLIISQHTHIPMGCSRGHDVTPFAAQEQEQFTRSLRLPGWLSRAVQHFDAHELHHMYPFVPGYHLRHIDYAPANEVGWAHWIGAARGVPGEVLLFQNRDDTGFDL